MTRSSERKIEEALSLLEKTYSVLYDAQSIESYCMTHRADDMQYNAGYAWLEDYVADMGEALVLLEETLSYVRSLLR